MNGKEKLTKLHLVNSLFAKVTGNDLYLAKQIDEAIEFSLDEKPESTYSDAAAQLLEQLACPPGHGFQYCDAAGQPAPHPLWLRNEVLRSLRRLLPYRSATLVVTNLRQCVCPEGSRWTRRTEREYQDTIAYLRELGRTRFRASGRLTMLFF